MLAKLFLLAVVCVSFVQVRGDDNELKKAIERGISRLGDFFRIVEDDIENFTHSFEGVNKEVPERIHRVVAVAESKKEEVKIGLHNMAKIMKEKAQGSPCPDSAVECIDGFHSGAVKNIENLRGELSKIISDLASLTLEEIRTFQKPMEKLRESVRGTLNETIRKVKICGDVKSVEYLVSMTESWIKNVRNEIAWFIREVARVFTGFEEELTDYSNEYKKQLVKTKSLAFKNMRLCVFNRNILLNNEE